MHFPGELETRDTGTPDKSLHELRNQAALRHGRFGGRRRGRKGSVMKESQDKGLQKEMPPG